MARKQFSIIYPDGSKKHIGANERQQLLLANEIKKIDAQTYAFHGQVRTLHSFSELADLYPALHCQPAAIQAYLPGSFIFIEPRTAKRRREAMETPEYMCLRLELA